MDNCTVQCERCGDYFLIWDSTQEIPLCKKCAEIVQGEIEDYEKEGAMQRN